MATTSCIERRVGLGLRRPGSSSPGCEPSCRSACGSRSSWTACPTPAPRCTSASARSTSRTPAGARPTTPSSKPSSDGCTTSGRAPSWSRTTEGWPIASSGSERSTGASTGSRTRSISAVVDHACRAYRRRPSAGPASGNRRLPPRASARAEGAPVDEPDRAPWSPGRGATKKRGNPRRGRSPR